jgi:type I restriction enzyme S subunit
MNDVNVPEGYKSTDIGVIPEDWEVELLGNLFTFKNGVNADKKHYGKGIKFINVLEVIQKNCLFYKDIPGFITLNTLLIQQNLVKKGDVLFNRTSETQEEVGLTAVYLDDKDVVFGGFVIRARPITDLINNYYSKYGFSSKAIRNQVIKRGQGAVRANIGQSDLKTILFPLPPLPEQKAIARVLSDVDELIRECDSLLAKKRDIKQGTMQQLLTGKKRLPGFSGEWKEKKLGDIGEFKKGKSIPKKELTSEGLPCILYGEIYTKYNNVSEVLFSYISLSTSQQATLIRQGDILFAGSGETIEEIGKCFAYIGNKKAYAGGDIIIFSAQNNDSIYLGYLLNSFYVNQQKSALGQGSSVIHIYSTNLKKISILLPTLAEQKAIAEILSDMDAEIEALEQKRDKYKAIKQGMMQELLTGKTRLMDN